MTSNREKSVAAVFRLRTWLESKPAIPTYRGRVNRTKICQIIGVPVSTIRTNKQLAALLEQIVAAPPISPPLASTRNSESPAMIGLLQKIETQQAEIDHLRQELARFQLLLSAGVANL